MSDGPECPHCGACDDNDCIHEAFGKNSDHTILECESCGKEYECWVDYDPVYYTAPTKPKPLDLSQAKRNVEGWPEWEKKMANQAVPPVNPECAAADNRSRAQKIVDGWPAWKKEVAKGILIPAPPPKAAPPKKRKTQGDNDGNG